MGVHQSLQRTIDQRHDKISNERQHDNVYFFWNSLAAVQCSDTDR